MRVLSIFTIIRLPAAVKFCAPARLNTDYIPREAMKKTVVMGVTSGIAAVKVPELIRLLRKEGYDVPVILTRHATGLMPKSAFETASGQAVYTDLFPEGFDYRKVLTDRRVEHVDLADRASVVVICPATANIIAKLAHGLADDFLTTTVLATTAAVLVCPSMNVHMWENPVVRENLDKLRSRGFFILDPAVGELACGYEGKGRLADVRLIRDEIVSILSRSNTWKGKRVIVTSGGTTEFIDRARTLTNRSTGKMGAALADAASQMGADVTILRSKTSVAPRRRRRELFFETSAELSKLLENEVPDAAVVFHAAAVSDFTVKGSYAKKLSSGTSHRLTLVPAPKILPRIKQWNPKAVVVGFKAAHEPDIQKLGRIAKKKLRESGADAIVGNDISRPDRGFAADTNEVVVVTKSDSRIIPLSSKRRVAEEIVDYISSNFSSAFAPIKSELRRISLAE